MNKPAQCKHPDASGPGKWRSAADAVDIVESGSVVALGHLGAEPVTLTQELWTRAYRLRDVTLLSGMMVTGYGFLGIPNNPFRLKTWFMPGTLMSGSMREVVAEYLPLNWTQTARYLRSGIVDTAIVQVSDADVDGYHSLGISVGQHRAMVDGARRVIAEVNSAMPRTCGDSLIHQSQIDILVRGDHDLLPFPNRAPGEAELLIGRRVAEMIPDGSWVQFGIGSIPGAMLKGLIALGRRGLRILSQVTDPARELIEAGCCVEGAPKALVGEVLGSRELYAWSNGNRDLHMTDALATHSPESFAARERFVSVNSALEIDLLGQINSEWLDGRQAGAIGGSMDFALAAQLEGNRSIIAINSVTNKGKSRIVPILAPGPVTVPRSLVQFVVTEFGSVDLRNRTVGERAQALAAISHPDHREELEKAAFALR
ncbi:acetyl-CoA hydrolase/transferase C-terminal domain-containing protein [Xanthobacter autotrophicus DSM 431]|uniref:acetyl-CoA hydrolase/transferase family protein n=1 Tax=Xanthobacter nonsaccharivorans TaxID=3119912 RepID=UPI00372AF6BD